MAKNNDGKRSADRRPSRLDYLNRAKMHKTARARAFGRWLAHRREARAGVAALVFKVIDPQSLFVRALSPTAANWPISKLRRYARRHGHPAGLVNGVAGYCRTQRTLSAV